LEQVAVTVIGGSEVGGAVGVVVVAGVGAGAAGGGGAKASVEVGVGVAGWAVGWTGAEAQAARPAVATSVVIARVNFMTARR
jgi:hypothetical protein